MQYAHFRKNIVIRVAVFGMVAAVFAGGQAHGSQSPPQRLTLKLRALSQKVCIGSFIPLEMTLTNDGDIELTLNNLEIWSNFGIKFVDSDGKKQEAGTLVVPGAKEEYDRMKNEVVTIKPASPYITTFKYPLGDPRVFDSPRSYEINSAIYYNSGREASTSNYVTFEAVDCKTN